MFPAGAAEVVPAASDFGSLGPGFVLVPPAVERNL